MTAKPSRRQTIESALRECPVGRRIDTHGFSQFMQVNNLTFEVARVPWKLIVFLRTKIQETQLRRKWRMAGALAQ